MFETATWRTHNRKHFAVVEEIYRQAGVPFGPEPSRDASDGKFAATIAHMVGSHLLSGSIYTATTKKGKGSQRLNGRAWKVVGAQEGARASIFLVLAAAGILTPELGASEENSRLVGEVRELLLETFSVPDEDLDRIDEIRNQIIEVLNEELTKEAVARGGLADRMAIQRGETAFSWYAMKMAGIDVDELPAFQPVRRVPPEHWEEIQGLEWFLTVSIAYDVVWNHRLEELLDLAALRSTGAKDFRLLERALELQAEVDWQWADVPAVAVVKSADQLSNFREEYNLVLDAISLGYWLRQAELELDEGFNSFDPSYCEELQKSYDESDEPDMVIKIGMVEVSQALPKPFAGGAELWEQVRGLAATMLEQRAELILAAGDVELDPEARLSEEVRDFAFRLGYGLGVTVEALEIDGIQPGP
jgi:hypothetical protein